MKNLVKEATDNFNVQENARSLAAHDIVSNRYDFTIFIDVTYGNPNGDPDADASPRVDPETSIGYITDVCIKHKIRNVIRICKNGEYGYRLYIGKDTTLNAKDKEACAALGIGSTEADLKQAKKDDPDTGNKLRAFMCENFYDVRTFGAVMTTFTKGALNCAQCLGPVQIGFGQSVDPVTVQRVALTREAITTEEDAARKDGEFGGKYVIPYGLYRIDGSISVPQAKVTGFTEGDLDLLWDAIMNMFDFEHSAMRGRMATRKLIIFKHDSEYGNAPSHKLMDRITAERKDKSVPARSYSDYTIDINTDNMPEGVKVIVRE